MKTKRITMLGVMLSLSIVLSIVDSMISLVIIPSVGVKLGLANVVTLLIMYQFGEKDALLVAVLRIILVALLRASPLTTLMMSMSGGLLAFGLMYVFKKINKFSPTGVSVTGAVGHSVGQILMGIFIIEQAALIYYLPYVLFFSVIAGVLTGIVATIVLRILKNTF